MKKRQRIIKKYRDSKGYYIIEEKFMFTWTNIEDYISPDSPLEFESVSDADSFIDNHSQLNDKSGLIKEVIIRK